MLFKNTIGHKDLINNWTQAYADGRLHPVQLLQGQEGSGALLLALAFAQFLLCEQRQQSSDKEVKKDSCGVCSTCLRVQAFSHPDLHFFYPVIGQAGSKEKKLSHHYLTTWKTFLEQYPYGNLHQWVNMMDTNASKQPNISVDECRYFIDIMGKKPYEGSRKVILLWLPEFLGKEANRLLKMLEEPMDDTYLLLITQDVKFLLPTLVSRCLTLVLSQPMDEDIDAYLLAHHSDLDASARAFLINKSQGNLKHLHEYISLGKETEQDIDNDILILLDSLLVGGPARQVEWINKIVALPRNYTEYLLQQLKFYLHLLGQAKPQLTDNTAVLDKFIAMGLVNKRDLLDEAIDKSLYAIRRNANLKMELHDFIIQFDRLLKHNTILFPIGRNVSY